MKAAYKINWTESERGWGSRSDGTTLHVSLEEAKKYIREYWERERKRNSTGNVPECYSFPSEPMLCEINNEIESRLQSEPSFWITMSTWWDGK